MKMVKMILAVLAAASLVSLAQAEDKKEDTKTQLVGKWEATKVDEGTIPMGTIVEFTKDGKVKITIAGGGDAHEGTYTVAGESVTVILKKDGNEDTHKVLVKKLTKTGFEATNAEGKTIVFSKAK